MLEGLMVGQYLPGTSFVHRLDPRTKLVSSLLIIASALTARGWGFLPVAVGVLAAAILSGVPLLFLWRGLKYLWFILVFTFLLQLFFTPGEVLYHLGPLQITREGLLLGGQMLARLILLVLSGTLLTLTTSPLNLSAGLEILMGPLKRVGFPVHEISLMMSVSLRFIPTLLEETQIIIKSQQSRGASFGSGGLKDRMTAILSLMVPMFAGSLRRAEELATAMEARCYGVGLKRSRLHMLHYKRGDYLAYVTGAAILAGTVLLRVLV